MGGLGAGHGLLSFSFQQLIDLFLDILEVTQRQINDGVTDIRHVVKVFQARG